MSCRAQRMLFCLPNQVYVVYIRRHAVCSSCCRALVPFIDVNKPKRKNVRGAKSAASNEYPPAPRRNHARRLRFYYRDSRRRRLSAPPLSAILWLLCCHCWLIQLHIAVFGLKVSPQRRRYHRTAKPQNAVHASSRRRHAAPRRETIDVLLELAEACASYAMTDARPLFSGKIRAVAVCGCGKRDT